jgi:hypothetical protein
MFLRGAVKNITTASTIIGNIPASVRPTSMKKLSIVYLSYMAGFLNNLEEQYRGKS